jgi:FtsZ-binding cell division protein ZapB
MANKRTSQTHTQHNVINLQDDEHALREHQQAWEAFAVCAVRLIPVLKAQMAAVTDETERSAIEIMTHLRVLSSTDSGVSVEDRGASLAKVVVAMQFQDITRQKLEHVGQALDQWSNHLQALLKGPGDSDAKGKLAALEKLEESYTMEEERRLHAAALMPEYQEPVPTDVVEPVEQSDSVTLF